MNGMHDETKRWDSFNDPSGPRRTRHLDLSLYVRVVSSLKPKLGSYPVTSHHLEQHITVPPFHWSLSSSDDFSYLEMNITPSWHCSYDFRSRQKVIPRGSGEWDGRTPRFKQHSQFMQRSLFRLRKRVENGWVETFPAPILHQTLEQSALQTQTQTRIKVRHSLMPCFNCSTKTGVSDS